MIKQCRYVILAPFSTARQCKRNGVWDWTYPFLSVNVKLCKQHWRMEERHANAYSPGFVVADPTQPLH